MAISLGQSQYLSPVKKKLSTNLSCDVGGSPKVLFDPNRFPFICFPYTYMHFTNSTFENAPLADRERCFQVSLSSSHLDID